MSAPAPALRGVTACVFDAYGTLFDTGSAVAETRERFGADWTAFAALWRRKQLEYTWLRTLMGRHADFWHVTAEALDYALAATGRDDPALRAQLMQNYLALAAFPDALPLLETLRAAGRRTAILSNGTPTMLTAVVSFAGLARHLDAVLSVEAAGAYKPHASVYKLATDRLGVEPAQVLFVTANGWDAAGAATFGFHVAWVNRAGAPRDKLPGTLAAEVSGLSAIAPLLSLPESR